MKNVSFEEENEVRYIEILFRTDHSDMNYRTKNNLIIPHKELQLDSEKIKEITIGPSLDKDLNYYSLLSLKIKNQLKYKITKSPIPYRGW